MPVLHATVYRCSFYSPTLILARVQSAWLVVLVSEWSLLYPNLLRHYSIISDVCGLAGICLLLVHLLHLNVLRIQIHEPVEGLIEDSVIHALAVFLRDAPVLGGSVGSSHS
jgi:hypothetical protein